MSLIVEIPIECNCCKCRSAATNDLVRSEVSLTVGEFASIASGGYWSISISLSVDEEAIFDGPPRQKATRTGSGSASHTVEQSGCEASQFFNAIITAPCTAQYYEDAGGGNWNPTVNFPDPLTLNGDFRVSISWNSGAPHALVHFRVGENINAFPGAAANGNGSASATFLGDTLAMQAGHSSFYSTAPTYTCNNVMTATISFTPAAP